MNRRNFIGGLALTAAVRTWPFRVYSFPTQIKPVIRYSVSFTQFNVDGGELGRGTFSLWEREHAMALFQLMLDPHNIHPYVGGKTQ